MTLRTALAIWCATALAFCMLGGGVIFLAWYLLETYVP